MISQWILAGRVLTSVHRHSASSFPPASHCARRAQEIFAKDRKFIRELEDYLESSVAFLQENRSIAPAWKL